MLTPPVISNVLDIFAPPATSTHSINPGTAETTTLPSGDTFAT